MGKLKYRSLFFSFIIGIGSILGWTGSTWAIVTERISALDGAKPYVIKQAENESEQHNPDLGVYVQTRKGKLKKIISGSILGHSIKGSILAQLPLITQDQRYPMLAVVNGRLVLFHLNTELEKPDTFLEFGSKDTPVKDILTGRTIALPKIHSADDVHVHIVPLEDKGGYQLLVSMKVANDLLHGNGITFAAFIKAGKSSEDQNLAVSFSPTIIDHHFYSIQALSGLVMKDQNKRNSSVVVAPSLAWQASMEDPDDLDVQKEWKKDLHGRLELLQANKYDSSAQLASQTNPLAKLPQFDTFRGKKILSSLPIKNQAITGDFGISLYQTYGVLGEGNKFVLTYSSNRKLELTGQLNTQRRDQKDVFRFYSNPDSSSTKLMHFENQLYLLNFSNMMSVELLKLTEAEKELPQEVSLFSRYVSGENKNYLIVSFRTREGDRTMLYTIGSQHNQLHLIHAVKLSEQFFPQKELSHRFVDESGMLLFDDKTPPQADIDTYMNQVDYNQPLVMISGAGTSSAEKYRHIPKDQEGLGVERNGDKVFVKYGKGQEKELHVFSRASLYKRLSFVIKKVTSSEDNKVNFYCLVSIDAGVRAETWSLILKGTEAENDHHLLTLETVRSVRLNENFYPQKELSLRMSEGDDGGILFDDVTPVEITADQYLKTYVAEGVHIDLNMSSTEKLIRRFRKPMYAEKLSHNLEMRIYGQEGRVGPPSGLYVVDGKNKLQMMVLGQGLFPLDSNQKPQLKVDLELTSKSMHTEHIPETDDTSFSAHVVAMDPSFNRGEKSFSLMVVVQDVARKLDERFPIQLSLPWTRFRSAQIVSGDKKFWGHFFLLVSLAPEYEGDKIVQPGGVWAYPFQIKKHTKQNEGKKGEKTKETVLYTLGTPTASPHHIAQQVLSQEELKNRVVTDSVGRLHFELTPEIDHADLDYEVLSLIEYEKIRPNATNRKSDIKINHDDREPTYRKGYSWRIASRNANRPEVKDLKSRDLTEFQQDLYPTVTAIQQKMVDHTAPPEHTVIIVPKELKNYLRDLLIARYIDDEGTPKRWSHKNQKAPLFLFDSKSTTTQDELFESIGAIRETEGRPLLLVDLAELQKSARLRPRDRSGSEHQSFHLQEKVALESDDDTSSDEEPDAGMGDSAFYPHSLYMMSTEGDRLSLQDFSKKRSKNRVPMLFWGTENEWKQVKDSVAQHEGKYGLIETFQEIRLENPSIGVRRDSIKKDMERPEIALLNLEFDASSLKPDPKPSSADSQNILLEYMVKKSERLAIDEKKDPVSYFYRIKKHFLKTIQTNEVLKKTRTINRNFIDQLMADVFKIRLRLDVLEPNDYLKRLSEKNAATQWQKFGYNGRLDLKHEVIKTILSQLKRNETLKVPASMIILGKTRSGKTSLVMSLAKWLGFKQYDMNKGDDSDNDDANFFVLSAPQVLSAAQGQNDSLSSWSMETWMQNLHHFLTLKKGSRGWILIDDAHQLSPEDRKTILTYVRKLQEDDYYTVKSPFTHEVIVRPTQNLGIFMTLNPTDDVERIKKFMPDYLPWSYKKPTPEQLAKATLLTGEMTAEDSWITRWNLFLTMDTYAHEAKGPGLINEFSVNAKDLLESEGHVALVDQSVVTSLVTAFPNENVKNFQSPSIEGLFEKVQRAMEGKRKFAILVPRSQASQMLFDGTLEGLPSVVEKTNIPDFIDSKVDVVVPGQGYLGHFHLIRIMMDKFRVRLIEEFVTELGQNAVFSGDSQLINMVLAPAYRAIGRHIFERGSLPLSQVSLDPYMFGAHRSLEKDLFEKSLKSLTENEPKQYFPFDLSKGRRIEGILNALSNHNEKVNISRGTAEFFQDVSKRIETVLEKELQVLLQVNSMTPFPDHKQWLTKLREVNTIESYQRIAISLTKIYEKFLDDVYRTETKTMGRYSPETYDMFRIFMYLVDKAIAQLPWANVSVFMVNALQYLSHDVGLAQAKEIHQFLYSDPNSLLKPTTQDLVAQMIVNDSVIKAIDEKEELRLNEQFLKSCEEHLKRKDRR